MQVEQSYKEAEALLADALGTSGNGIVNLMHRKPGTAAGAAELLARRDVALRAADDLLERAKKVKAGKASVEEMAQFGAAVDRAGMLFSMFMGARAEAGRALNILRQTARVSQNLEQLNEVINSFGGNEDLSKIAEILADPAVGPAGRLQVARQASKPKALDALIELWKAGLLTGPITHLTNVVSNSVFTAMRIPEHFIAGLYGAISGGTSMTESVAMSYGMLAGAVDGMKHFWRGVLSEDYQAPGGNTITESHQHAIAGDTFGLKGKPGVVVDWIGKAVRAPSFRMLTAKDAFFRVVNLQMTIHAAAVRQTLKEGKKQWHRGFAHRVAQLINEAKASVVDPKLRVSPEASAIAEEGIQAALRYTFQEKLGIIGRSFTKLRTDLPALHFVLPFLRTPTNIFRQGLERTPLAPLVGQWRDDIKAGGTRRDQALARTTMGTALGFMVVSMAMAGAITGGGSPDKEERKRRREAKIPDYAILINGQWYEYRRLEPLGVVLGMAADASEIWQYMKQDERERIVSMISMAVAQNVTSKTFMSGISDLINSIGDPERYGDLYINRLAGSLVPAAVGQVAHARDPKVRDPKVYGRDAKEMGLFDASFSEMANTIKARVPETGVTPEFNTKALPVKRDSYGEEIERMDRTFPFSPIRTSSGTTDPVRNEAYRLKVRLGEWPGQVSGVKLNPDEKWKYAEKSGKLLHRVMTEVVKAPGYRRLPDSFKREVWDEVKGASREIGEASITPSIIGEIVNNAIKTAKELGGTQ